MDSELLIGGGLLAVGLLTRVKRDDVAPVGKPPVDFVGLANAERVALARRYGVFPKVEGTYAPRLMPRASRAMLASAGEVWYVNAAKVATAGIYGNVERAGSPMRVYQQRVAPVLKDMSDPPTYEQGIAFWDGVDRVAIACSAAFAYSEEWGKWVGEAIGESADWLAKLAAAGFSFALDLMSGLLFWAGVGVLAYSVITKRMAS